MAKKRLNARRLAAILVVLVAAMILLIMYKDSMTGMSGADGGLAAEFRRRMERAASSADIDDAVNAYREIAKDASAVVAEYNAGIADIEKLKASGKHGEALGAARELADKFLGHKRDDRNITRADELAKKGDNEQAVERYLQVLQAFSAALLVETYTHEPLLLIADLLIAEKPAAAKKEYEAAIERATDPRMKAQGYAGLGALAAGKNDLEGALRHYKTAMELTKKHPDDLAEYSFKQAEVLRGLSRYGDSLDLLVDVMRRGGMRGELLNSVEKTFLDTIDAQASAIETTGGPVDAAEIYLKMTTDYTEVPDWLVQWRMKAARMLQRGGEFGRARTILGRLWHNRDEDIDPVWTLARMERMGLDEVEKSKGTTSFLGGIRAKIAREGYRCRIVDKSIEEDTTWSPDDGDVIVDDRVTVARDAKLTIKAGTVVKFTINSSLIVYGSLHALGTKDAEILFESSSPQPSPFDWGLSGDDRVWGGVQFVGHRAGGESVLEYCVVRHAATALLCEKARVSLKNCRVTLTGVAAIVVSEQAAPEIINCRLHDNDGDGLICKTSSKPVITGCIVENNGLNGMVFGQNCEPTVTNTVVRGNKGKGIVCFNAMGGKLVDCEISGNFGPGVSCETSSVPEFVRCLITKNKAYGISTFDRADPTFTECRIIANEPGGLISATASPTLKNCVISDNAEFGVRSTLMAEIRLRSCVISGNPVGIQIEEASRPSIRNCDLSGNSKWSLVLLGELNVNVSDNWWGTSDLEEIAGLIRVRKAPGAARVEIGTPLTAAPNIAAPPEEIK